MFTDKKLSQSMDQIDCPYYTDSGTCLPLYMDVPNNVPAFFGDFFNVITAPFNIIIAWRNHRRRIARRKFKLELMQEFLSDEIYKREWSEVKKWFARICESKNYALSIRDVCTWEERLLLLQQQAKLRDVLNEIEVKEDVTDQDSFQEICDRLGGLLNYKHDNKVQAINTQTVSGIIKHAVFGIAGILGICGIIFGVVALSIACLLAIPLIAAVGFQAISGINTLLWSGANSVENGSKLKYAHKKKKKLEQYGKDLKKLESIVSSCKLSKEILDGNKHAERIRAKKLRNSRLRCKMEKYRAVSLVALIGGAVCMSISSIMLAVGTLLSSSVVGLSVGVPIMIAGGILGTIGAVSFIGGYAGFVWTRQHESKKKEEYRKEDQAGNNQSDIRNIIGKDQKLEVYQKKLYEVQKEGDKRTLGLVGIGMVVAVPAIPLSFLIPPLAIVFTIAATALLTLGVASSICTAIKAHKIREKIVRSEYRLMGEVKKINEYSNMPRYQSKPKLKFLQKISSIFSRTERLQTRNEDECENSNNLNFSQMPIFFNHKNNDMATDKQGSQGIFFWGNGHQDINGNTPHSKVKGGNTPLKFPRY